MVKLQEILKILSTLSKREKIIFYITSVFILFVVLDRLVIYPVYSRIRSLDTEINKGKEGIARDLRILAQREKIGQEVKKYTAFLSPEGSEEETMTSLQKEIESLANKSSLYIIDMKAQGVKVDKDKIKKYQVVLSCEGQMEQLIEFMYSIENLSSLFSIEKYQISPKSKDSTVVQCSMTISKVYMP